MAFENTITVLKFGSSVLRDEADVETAVREIARHRCRGERVLAVVSAVGDTTDRLLAAAGGDPDPAALAALLATGEAASAALLGLALGRAGVPARVLDPHQAGLRTVGARLDAELVAVDRDRLLAELDDHVVVLPGFVGRDEHGGPTLLGRGGSDLTALFLAERLGGRCVLLKDVDGIYTGDPSVHGGRAARFAAASWATAARVGGRLVQPKSIRFAESRGLRFEVAAPGGAPGTRVGPGPDLLAGPALAAAAEVSA